MMKTNAELPKLLQAFFTDRLMNQRKASQHTIASYRDTFRLLLGFATQQLKKAPSKVDFEDLDTPFVGSFLEQRTVGINVGDCASINHLIIWPTVIQLLSLKGKKMWFLYGTHIDLWMLL